MSAFKILCATLAVVAALGAVPASAAQVECDAAYCFTAQDFSQTDEPVSGICITGLPDPETGTVMLGQRVVRSGDILTAQQVAQMTFAPLRTQTDTQATVTYLPIYENRVAPAAQMTISIRGKEDKPPVAQDSTLETYRNLPNQGTLRAEDPEGEPMTYTLLRQPRKGEVVLGEDGSFQYTPKKNKVGVDSFSFTATDPAGNVSREATVTVQILKPTDARQYADTAGTDCRFEAEWLKNSGLFSGETVSGQWCFCPEKTVSRGQFLAMAVKALDIPLQEPEAETLPADVPQWLRPYVAAALRSGLLAHWPQTQTGGFEPDAPVTGAQAAVLLQNALALQSQSNFAQNTQPDVPVWAQDALAVMAENGIQLPGNESLTRGQAAKTLYRISQLALTAPGMQVLRLI